MATVLRNAYISFATAGDISGDSNQVTLNYSAETLDDTVFGATTRTNTGGLKNWDAQVTVLNNFASGQIDSKIFPLVGTTGTLAIRASATGVGASNPQFTGGALLDSYQILGTSVGELPAVTITFKAAGALSRNVT
jgi:hypothetical protein